MDVSHLDDHPLTCTITITITIGMDTYSSVTNLARLWGKRLKVHRTASGQGEAAWQLQWTYLLHWDQPDLQLAREAEEEPEWAALLVLTRLVLQPVLLHCGVRPMYNPVAPWLCGTLKRRLRRHLAPIITSFASDLHSVFAAAQPPPSSCCCN